MAIDPSGSEEPAALKTTVSGAVPDVGVAAATASGGWFTGPPEAGTTSSVILAPGTVSATELAGTAMSVRRVMALVLVSW